MDYDTLVSLLKEFGYPTVMSFMMFYLVTASLKSIKTAVNRLDKTISQFMISILKEEWKKERCQKDGDG